MLVASPGHTEHQVARDLPDLLHPGDVLVVNTSDTVPAAVEVTRNGARTTVHLSTELDNGQWVVEVRRPDGSGHPDVRADGCCGSPPGSA